MLVEDASSAEPEVSEDALSRITSDKALVSVIRQAAREPIWRSAMARLSDPKALLDLLRSDANTEIRLAALERVDDPKVLRSIAVDDERRETALAALERIDDVDALKEIARKAKVKGRSHQSEKTGRRAQRAEPRRKGGPTRAQKASRSADAALSHRRGGFEVEVMGQAEAQIETAKQAWAELDEHDPELQKRFDKAVERFVARREAYEAERARREAERERLASEAAERAEQQAQQAAEDDEKRKADEAEREVRRQQDQEHREKEEARRAELLAKQIEEAAALCEQAEAAVALESLEEASYQFGGAQRTFRKLKRAFDEKPELLERFSAAEKRLQQRRTEEEEARQKAAYDNLQRLTGICEQLEGLMGTSVRKDLEQAMSDAQKAFRRMGPLPTRQDRDDLKARYEKVRKDLFIHLQDLREADEWKRWSNVGRKEELVTQVEALKKEEDLKVAAKRLKELQAAWKKLGPVSRDRADELWERFKKGCDEVYERCGDYFKQLDEERRRTCSAKSNCASKSTRCRIRRIGKRPPTRSRRCKPSGRRSDLSRASNPTRYGSAFVAPAIRFSTDAKSTTTS
jgi:hypothetical protein